MAVKQDAGRKSLGEFAPEFAHLNDDVLFGEVWSRESLSLRDRSLITVVSLLSQGLVDSSFRYHLINAKKNGVSKYEMAEVITHVAFYCGWPKAWAAFNMAKEVYDDADYFMVANQIKMPKIGFGTWMIPDDEAPEKVLEAIRSGYRLIDTAQAYENESGVGKGIRLSGLRREELFICSKIRAEYKTYDEAKKSIDETLERMGLTYLDQMIIHAPEPWNEFRGEKKYHEENREVWRALEDARDEGKIRVIGVSNFLKDDLENILSSCRVKPMVNQILLHIQNTDMGLVDFCKKNNILVEAYSPIAHGEVLKSEPVRKMAEKYHVSVAQLCIRYVLQLGALPLPKAYSPEHIRENMKTDFVISDEDMDVLIHLPKIENYGEFSYFPVFSK